MKILTAAGPTSHQLYVDQLPAPSTLLLVERTQEIILFTGLAFIRGYGSVPAQPLYQGDRLVNIGAYIEGKTAMEQLNEIAAIEKEVKEWEP